MALQRQVVPVPFAHGLDTKTDPKQVIQGKFLTLENGIFTSPGRIQKRNGYEAFGQFIEGTSTLLSQGAGLAQFNNELLLLTENEAYSYSDSTTRWTDKQTITNLQLSSEQVVRNTFIQNTPDSAIHPSGVQVVTYQDSRGGSRYCVIDSITGDQIVSDKLITSTAIKPKPYVIGNFIVIFYIDTASDNLMGLTIPVVTPSLPLAPRSYALGISVAHPNYDVTTYGTFLFITFNSSASGIGTFYINAFLSPGATVYEASESASSCITITADQSNGQIWVAYGNGTNIKYFILSNILTPVLAPTIITTDTDTLNIVLSVANHVGEVFFTTIGSIPSNNFITSANLTNTGTVTNIVVFVRSVSIAGKPFTYGGFTYITVSFDTVLQPTYFTLRTIDASVVAKFIQDDGGGTPVTNMVPEAASVKPGIYYIGALEKDLLTTISGAVYTQTGVNLIELDFPDAFTISAQLGGNTHLTGAILSMYDGTSIVEHGFDYFPENITYTQSSSGGAIAPGTYEYFVVYSWMDAQGQTHYSAPSVGFQVIVPVPATIGVTFTSTFAAGVTTIVASNTTNVMVGQVITDETTPAAIGAGTYITAISGSTLTLSSPTLTASTGADTIQSFETSAITLTIPTLRLTQKKPPIRTPVVIQVYRTEDSQTIGYLVSSSTMPLLNNVNVDTVTFVDTENDTEIIGNPILYTTGGVLENIAAPAFSYITTYQDRIIGFPEEDPFQWWYSKQNINGAPVEFTDSFVNNINQAGGELVSALQMDSELIFFQQYQIQYITGVGPDATGNQNNFSAPLNIASDVGCSDKNSLVLTPAGILFKSLKGIYLLPRNLTSLQYIGAGVEAYNQYDVTSAQLIENTQQVRFCLSNGQALVYDYFVHEWSVFTNHPTVDSVIFQGLFTYLTMGGLVLQETPGQFTDNGNFIKLRLVTSWLSFVGLQGYQRVRNLLFLGDYFNPHNVAIYAAYDFNTSTSTQQNIIQAGNILGTGVYGSDATYGETSPYGGPPNTYQFRVPLSRQKCESIQITIEDQALYSSFGENLALSAFSFEVGLKDTLNKIVAQGSNTQTP